MRRSRGMLIALAAIGASVVGAVPASADPPERSTFTVAECFSETTAFEIRQAGMGPVSHASAENGYDLYVKVADNWSPAGTNETRASGTFHGDVGTFHGEFSLRSEVLGDFDGTWAWGMSAQGTAVGRSPDGRSLLRLNLYEDAAPYEEVTGEPMPGSPDEMCGVTTYHVMQK